MSSATCKLTSIADGARARISSATSSSIGWALTDWQRGPPKVMANWQHW